MFSAKQTREQRERKKDRSIFSHGEKGEEQCATVRMNSRIFSDPFALVSREEEAERLTPAESLSYRRLSERGRRRFAATVRKKVLRVSLLKIQTREFPRE